MFDAYNGSTWCPMAPVYIFTFYHNQKASDKVSKPPRYQDSGSQWKKLRRTKKLDSEEKISESNEWNSYFESSHYVHCRFIIIVDSTTRSLPRSSQMVPVFVF
ncbi:hypothetical protein PanWU01x14_008240 [Parasponia andersonii]|uniref:Uncharacterized protein n=1 Tax=Parasponia andersonii TaxID=3476 RepID=A0A2P5E4A6_PARAD|nr:hypothetical protein PanWU01x14_008240 [Parasponia andersonii]